MIQIKVIAFYLPQFHQIPENDQWWGEGFTEWTNTRKAEPLFKGHYQPREPLNNNYYNLLDDDVRQWQADIAKRHGVYGFCYYHYWFNGKRLLEKPLEKVLSQQQPDFPFCLSWANEPWTRAWDGSEKEVLMPQNYGNEEDWRNHFLYLVKVFQDKRYIKVKNKPVFIIYRPSSIDNCSSMLNLWNEWAKEYGFDGIHFIETLTTFDNDQVYDFMGAIEFEPMYTITHDNSLVDRIRNKVRKTINNNSPRIVSFDNVWRRILKRENPVENRVKTYKGAFVDWDNSARKGRNSLIIKGSTPEKFGKYIKQLSKKVDNKAEDDFIFINAWNEWAEGTYLEPDKKNKYRYLEELKKVVDRVN